MDGGKRASLAWHRRAGKDDLCLHFAAIAAHERIGNIWHMLPEAAQARKAIWLAVNPKTGKRRIDEAFPLEIRANTNDQEMMIRFKNGSTWQLCGSDNYNSLVGSSPMGIIFSEYAVANPSAWAYLRPILLENSGWAVFISTPRGKNHFYLLHQQAKKEGWFQQSLSNNETKVFTEDQLQGELRELQAEHGDSYGEAIWKQEYFVSFEAAIPGSIFGEWLDRAQKAGRIGKVPFDKVVEVHTAWDLGRTDATAIWFYQHVGSEIHVIDYHESNLKDVPYYTRLLKDLSKTKGYRYGTHWLPHDARARTLAAGGKSIQQQMIDAKVGRIVIAKRLDHVDGIQAARATLPYCWFDEDNCESGLEVLRHYHYEWDEEAKVFRSMPAHDWASHGSSAFRTLALSWRRPKERGPEAPIQDKATNSYAPGVTFGALTKQHFSKMRERRELH
jgi:phage terminase large subunit